MTRAMLRQTFLNNAGWAEALQTPLAGDASTRSYIRLERGADRAMLMDAPPETGQDVGPFVAIAEHLENLELSPPEIFAQDRDNGFLLLEDLGDNLFARLLLDRATSELDLYRAASDVLLKIQSAQTPKNIPEFGVKEMAEATDLAALWYCQTEDPSALVEFVRDVLTRTAGSCNVLVLRDYHAENLIWLPFRTGAARVGLLDFQDAVLGHPAYDLASLLNDARRDVSPLVKDAVLNRFVAKQGEDSATFRAAFHAISAQRNLRILGIFARLCLRDSKPHYIDFIPRVWANLMTDLAHPAVSELQGFVLSTFPVPTHDILEDLRARCGTAQRQ